VENPRPDKVAVVDEVRQRLDAADGVVVTEYRGLTVKALSTLRRDLRPVGGSYRVYKNTLVRLAADDLGLELNDLLIGPTALAFTETTPDGTPGDVVAVAKVMRDFARANPNLVVKGGLLSGQVLDAAGVGALADVESREVLLARLAGALAAPMQQFAGLLQALPRNFAYGLQALIDQGGAAGAPAGAAPVADEAAPAATDAPATADEDGAPATADDVAPAATDSADVATEAAPADTETDTAPIAGEES
jgi:large subunit ribosomal protein L10